MSSPVRSLYPLPLPWARHWHFWDWVQARFGDRLKALNEGMARDGAFYLFSLRLVPVFPFFLINLLMGLTPIRTWTYFWVSQLGMLLATIVYVNAGTQIARIDALSDIVSPALLGSFAALALTRQPALRPGVDHRSDGL